MKPKYSCIIIDHDDTSVDSTVKINYPAFLEIMKTLRPNTKIISPEEFIMYAFKGSISHEYYTKILNFNDEEMKEQFKIWQNYTKDKNPPFFDGMINFLKDYKNEKGRIIVASHSMEHMIKRHYLEFQKNDENNAIFPDRIFGWNDDPNLRKPSANIIFESIAYINNINSSKGKQDNKMGLEDVLVLDDLRPGLEMAKSAGANFAFAGWGHDIPEIKEYMTKNSNYTLNSIKELRDLVLG